MDDRSVKARSIQRELTRWIFLTTLSIFALAGITTGVLAYLEAREMQDEILVQIANLISDADHSTEKWCRYYRDSTILVKPLNGKRSQLGRIDHLSDGFDTVKSRGTSWRIYIITKSSNQRFVVAQQTELRNEIALANAASAALPICILAIILLVLIRWLIYARMKPVTQLAQAADNQTGVNLDLLSTKEIPIEILPFIEAINRLLLRTQATIDQQHRFIADASHELRTPITALSLLAENVQNATSPEQKAERMALLHIGLNRLNKLVNQLLNLARLQEAHLDTAEPVRLDEVIKESIMLLHTLAIQKNIDLGMEKTAEITVQNINQSLQQLVENAITNAIHYTPEHGKIDISLAQQENLAVLTIADTGPGISENDIENVFTPFYRSRNNQESGSGLGLAICKEVARRHNCTVTLKNRPSGGLLFIYRQPISSFHD